MTETVRSTRYPIDGRSQRIMAAAFTEFSRRGVRAARMSVIARRARVSLATLRQYFPTRDELFREVIRSQIVGLILQAQEPGTPNPDQSTTNRIRGFIRHFWRAMEEPDQAALLRLSLSDLSGYPELAVFHATEVIGGAVGRLEAVLSEGARRGEIDSVDIRTAARVILAALITYTVWFASPGVYGELTGRDRHRAQEAVIDLLVRALDPAAA
ncbi:MAG TPA: TetR/AcrR family transcriptional regulator [Gemmatimonadales bacterium]|nr:TetR/AcrR family transcriptional regulator [Gemmatimonadales bacterium]